MEILGKPWGDLNRERPLRNVSLQKNYEVKENFEKTGEIMGIFCKF